MTATIERKPIFDTVRTIMGRGFKQSEVTALDAAIDRALGVAAEPEQIAHEHPWMAEAARHLGLNEIPGRKHNPLILKFWRVMRRPYTDDETPWCGGFVGYCFAVAGIKGPRIPERAKAWADWGTNCRPRVGAVAVFGRRGGGHVGFVVGESEDNYYILGGNQRNQVNISPIAKSRLIAMRWPSNWVLGATRLPRMTGGRRTTNEA